MENYRIIKSLFIGMLLIFFTFQSYAQVQVTGTVRDNAGESLPGVTIMVKGTTQGVTTDIDGRYSIQVQGPQDVLVFTFVGMETQEIPVNGRTTVDVQMAQATIGVD